MALDAAEKERVRYHLGYLECQPAASIQYGIARPIETLFLVETAMDNILPVAEDRVRRLIQILDETECRIYGSQERLAAARMGDLETRVGEPDLLEKEYGRWAMRLADVLGVPLYAYSTRFRAIFGTGGAGTAGSIPVRG